ncbi:acyltransferase family protein [Dactylosporangium sp. CA-139114]|uniref:acyltransferase family protein n=1 Tax=Dactylosporangium sp. CA-139114 TaxID=3239931 RepID=UPI003D9915D7
MRRQGAGEQVDRHARLDWLDALRGVAVLLVVYEHATDNILRAVRVHLDSWFNPGQAGVFLFFVISGYIVPASLERRGDLRAFWTGRVFRLYPMMLAGMGATLIMLVTGVVSAQSLGVKHGLAAAIASTVMLQDILGLPSVPAVLWSLSYEMIFYLLVSALFVVRWHRFSAAWAVAWAGLAAGLGGLFPLVTLPSLGLGPRRAAVLVVLATVLGVGALVSRRPALVGAGAVVLTGLAAALLVTSGRFPGWFLLSIPALMFAGTALYRAEQGQFSWRVTAPAIGVVFACVMASAWWALSDLSAASLRSTRPWIGTLTLVAVLFVIGMGLRRRRVPRVLVRLGVISYSVYVVHYVVILWMGPVMQRHLHEPVFVQVLWALGFLALSLGISELTHRLVERPAQRLGRRVAQALDGRGRHVRQAPQTDLDVPVVARIGS